MNELRKYNFSTQAHAEIMQLRRENERLLKQVAELERREKYKQPVLPNNQTGYEDPLNRPSQAFPTRFNTWNNPAEPAKRKIKPEGLTQVYIIKDYYNLFLNMSQPLAAAIYLDFSNFKSAEEFRQRWNNYTQEKGREFYFEFHLFENGRQSLRSVFKVQNELCLWMSNNGRAHKMLEILKEHFDMDDTKCHVFEELPSFLKPFVPTYRK